MTFEANVLASSIYLFERLNATLRHRYALCAFDAASDRSRAFAHHLRLPRAEQGSVVAAVSLPELVEAVETFTPVPSSQRLLVSLELLRRQALAQCPLLILHRGHFAVSVLCPYEPRYGSKLTTNSA